RFAGTLGAKRICLGWNRIGLDLHFAEVVRVRHRVVHERGSDELTARVEVDVFHQHLARALRHTTVDLAMQQHGVENGADIIHHAVTHDVDHSGFPVDLHFADVTAVRKIL